MPLTNCWLLQCAGLFGAVCSAIVASSAGIGLAYAVSLDQAVPLWSVGVLCGVLGFGVAQLLTMLPNSVTTAVFVCHSRDGSFLIKLRPDISEQIVLARNMFSQKSSTVMDSDNANLDADYDTYSDYGSDSQAASTAIDDGEGP